MTILFECGIPRFQGGLRNCRSLHGKPGQVGCASFGSPGSDHFRFWLRCTRRRTAEGASPISFNPCSAPATPAQTPRISCKLPWTSPRVRLSLRKGAYCSPAQPTSTGNPGERSGEISVLMPLLGNVFRGSEAEGSAVPRTSPGNAKYYAQTELSSRPERSEAERFAVSLTHFATVMPPVFSLGDKIKRAVRLLPELLTPWPLPAKHFPRPR